MNDRFKSKPSISKRYVIVPGTMEDPENPGNFIEVFLIYDTATRTFLPGVHLTLEHAQTELARIISLGGAYNP